MKKFLISTALAASVAACSTTQVSNAEAEVLAILDQTELVVAQGCAYYAELSSLVALVNSGVVATAYALGTAFCNAVTSAVPTPAPASVARAMRSKMRHLRTSAAPVRYCTISGICGWK